MIYEIILFFNYLIKSFICLNSIQQPLCLLHQQRKLIFKHQSLHLQKMLPHFVSLLHRVNPYHQHRSTHRKENLPRIRSVNRHQCLLITALVFNSFLFPNHNISTKENYITVLKHFIIHLLETAFNDLILWNGIFLSNLENWGFLLAFFITIYNLILIIVSCYMAIGISND